MNPETDTSGCHDLVLFSGRGSQKRHDSATLCRFFPCLTLGILSKCDATWVFVDDVPNGNAQVIFILVIC